jgi:hypothetical protein
MKSIPTRTSTTLIDRKNLPHTRMTTPTASPRRLDVLDELQIEALFELLIDCVKRDASVSFMHPLTRDRAITFWRAGAGF